MIEKLKNGKTPSMTSQESIIMDIGMLTDVMKTLCHIHLSHLLGIVMDKFQESYNIQT